jgi:alpha-N-acetylglucosaminidase
MFITHTHTHRFRYYQNVCTESYSFVWWDWAQYEEHIDWMALNGVNLPLAFTGQEVIWKKIYMDLGLSAKDVDDYIAGPAFLAWWRMGNIQKWGGPIPLSYSQDKFRILRQIVKRMRSLGMTPILPAFSGNVPESLTKIFPNATIIRHPSWNKFNSSYSR